MTPLNIKEIISNIYKFSDGNTRMEKIKTNDTLISFGEYAPQQYLSYTVEDLKTDTKLLINGNKQNGYTQETQYKDNPIIELRTYYEDGNLKSVGKKFVQKQLSIIEYPVGITEIYDHEGKMTKIVDHNKTFRFSYQDVIAFLKMRDKDINIGSVIANEYYDGVAFWEIDYNSPTKGRSNIRINGHNGKILREGHHIKLIEN
jgi:hypothetical protein